MKPLRCTAALLLGLSPLGQTPAQAPAQTPAPAPAGPAFAEVAAQSGIDFHHFNGMSGKLYFAEHLGGSVAVFDYDNDGDLDVFFGQGQMIGDGDPAATPIPPRHPLPLGPRLYRNDTSVAGALRFTDVTAASGLRSGAYNMGVATGDYDNDGLVDLYLTNWGPNELWRNRGGGTFVDVTAAAGVGDPRWSVAASFFDYNRDGFLALDVGNYVEFRLATHKNCFSSTGQADYCGPMAYQPEGNRLYHNRGDGTFEDRTAALGMAGVAGATLGTAAVDLDGDGWLDLFVANDQMANEMWLNRAGKRFDNEATLAGTAVDAQGQPQACMGVVAEDLDGDARADLFVTNLTRETNTFYRNEGDGVFADVTRETGLGPPSFEFTGFGTAAFDYDLDGLLDLYVVNGAVKRIEDQVRAGEPLPLRQTNQLFRGVAPGRWEEVPADLREHPVYSEVSRGLAAGDLDNDGDTDLVVANNAGPARLLHNRTTPAPERWLGVRVLEPAGRRDALGSMVELQRVGRPSVWRRAHTDGSYAAGNDSRVRFALQPADTIAGLRVVWPDGRSERFAAPPRGAYTTLRQGTGEPVPATPSP